MLMIKVSGKQGEGKTQLISALTDALSAQGYSVIVNDPDLGEFVKATPITPAKGIVKIGEAPVYARKVKEG